MEVNSYTVDGPRLAQEWTSTGTHQGEIMGIPPTGRWVETYGCLITTCDDDGRVIEGAVYWNPLEMLRQLGLASRRVRDGRLGQHAQQRQPAAT